MSENTSASGNIKGAAKPRKIAKKITADYLHNSGLYYLQRFAASAAHFRRVMVRKVDKSCLVHPDQDRQACVVLVDALVEKFLRSGLLNDEIYTKSSVTSLRRRGLSSRAIAARLNAKGVSDSSVRDALDAHAVERDDLDSDLSAAVRLAQRRHIGPFRKPDKVVGERDLDRAMAAFARAGFGYEIARRVLSMETGEAENIIAVSR